jgi:NAD(P)H dehydrogenase (quinone)
VDHLIVVAHPLIDSITMKLARSFALELMDLGHRQRTSDLYRMGFDPVMSADELEPNSKTHLTPSDVALAQASVSAADAITVIYPLWWATMPAIMKGYIDRVFSRGFAYEATNGQARGLLAGKQCVLITLSGSPMSLLRDSGQWQAIDVLQDTHVFRSSGLELVEHVHIESVEPPVPVESIAASIERVRACARRHFSR